MPLFSRARRNGYYVSYGPTRRYICREVPETVYNTSSDGRVATTKRQTCAACGRFRSAKWEAAHPLRTGQAAIVAICSRCQRDKTSSEDGPSKCRRNRRHHHHHSRRCTDSTDDSYHSLKDRRSPRRYRSDSRDYSRSRPSPRDNIRIVIANQPGERVRRASTPSSSEEAVRLVRQTSVVEVPKRRRSRSKGRSSSRAQYLDDGTAQYFEDLVRPRRGHRSDSFNRISYVEEASPSRSRHRRRSSNSRVAFVDDDDEPVIVMRPPRRISRRRAVYFDGAASFEPSEPEDRGRPRSRSSRRHSSDSHRGVQLVDQVVTPNSVAVENNSESRTRLEQPRSRSTHYRSHDSHRGVQLVEEVIAPTSVVAENNSESRTGREQPRSRSTHHRSHDSNRGVHFFEEVMAPRHVVAERNSENRTSRLRPGSGSATPLIMSKPRRQISSTATNVEKINSVQNDHVIESVRSDSESDRDRTPRPAFASLHRDHRPAYLRVPSGQKRTHSTTQGSSSSRQSSQGPRDPNEPIFDRLLPQAETPQGKRRRRYRDDSTEDDYIAANYRHVRAPSPSPQTHPDYLSEMLESAHITPPSQQSSWRIPPPWEQSSWKLHGPPSPPRTRSNSRSESSSYQPPYYRDVTSAGAEYGPPPTQYSPVVDLYGNRMGGFDYEHYDDPEWQHLSQAEREYDWMT